MKSIWALLFVVMAKLSIAVTLTEITQPFPIDVVKYRIAAVTGHKGLDLTNSTIVADDKGFIWVGTQEGLIRLDGYHSERYIKSSKTTNTIAGNFVTELAYQANQQALWVGTATGVSRYHIPTKTFTNFNAEQAGSTVYQHYIQSIYVDEKNQVWVGTRAGLARFDETNQRFINIPLDAFLKNDYNTASISDIQQRKDGNELWVATRDQLIVLLGDTVIRALNPLSENGSKTHIISEISFETGNRLWIGTEHNGLLRYDIAEKNLVAYTRENSKAALRSNNIRTILLPRDNKTVWVGTDRGLSIFNKENEKFLPIFNNESVDEEVVALFEDSNKVIWIGTWANGLHRHNPNETQIGTISRSLLSDAGENLRRVIADPSGKIWFATYRTLFVLDSSNDSLSKIDISKVNELRKKTIPMWNSHTKSMYFLTDKLFRINPDKSLSEYNLPEPIRNLRFYGADFDTKGQLWLRSTSDGLYCIDPTFKKILYHLPSTISGFAQQIDPNTMVVGTQRASYFININSFRSLTHDLTNTSGLLNVNITGFYHSPNNEIWMGTSGGIHQLVSDYEKAEYRNWSTDDGLPTDVLTGPIPDKFDQLWFSSTDGLIRFNPKSYEFVQYDAAAGALSNYSIGQYVKDAEDRLYFMGPAGISIIDQSTITTNQSAQQVLISDVLIRSEDYRQKSVSTLLNSESSKETIEYRNELTLPANHRDFSVEFTTTYSDRADSTTFFYRLKGFDANWNETQSDNRRATYTNLEPGNYIFEVKAQSVYGVMSAVQKFPITLEPYFYETLWFKTLLFIVFSSLVAAWYRYRMYKIKEYNRTLKKEVEQRTRDINTLAEIGKDITAILNVDDLSEYLYRHLNNSLRVNVVGIGIYEPENQRVKFEKTYENNRALPLFYKKMDVKCELAAWCIHYNKEVILNHYYDRYHYIDSEEKAQVGQPMESVIYVPIVSRSQIKLGCITIQSLPKNAFSQEDLSFIRTISNYTGIALDNAIAHQELKKASYTDYLTNLPNRRAFLEQARYQLRVENRSTQPLAFAIADIDHFKQLNDTYGHDAGDYVLQMVANLFKDSLREQDMVARWGGEEFVFMFPNTETSGAKIALDKIRKKLANLEFKLKNTKLTVSATFGICGQLPKLSIEEIIDIADNALYEGKHAGRNRVLIAKQSAVTES